MLLREHPFSELWLSIIFLRLFEILLLLGLFPLQRSTCLSTYCTSTQLFLNSWRTSSNGIGLLLNSTHLLISPFSAMAHSHSLALLALPKISSIVCFLVLQLLSPASCCPILEKFNPLEAISWSISWQWGDESVYLPHVVLRTYNVFETR